MRPESVSSHSLGVCRLVAYYLSRVYGPDMSARKRILKVPRPRLSVGLLMLLLGIVSMPSIGLKAIERPHCAQHEQAGRHERHLASLVIVAHAQGQPAWTQAHDHGCPHCPASECARVAPCTGSTTTAVAPSRAVVEDLDAHRVAVDLTRQLAHSAVSPPATPPPQLIA